ncbi:hypothetical protein ACR77J_07275 [Tissierella praeacuta]
MLIYNDEDELVGEKAARFEPSQLVYIVRQKRKKITIIQTKIDYISCLDTRGRSEPLEYLFRYHTYYDRKVYWDDSKDIFDNKEDAYKYAEQLDKRRNIKFIKMSY